MAKVRIPKRVGGVKVPRKVRRKAKKALKVAESPEVREFAARALGVAAARVKSARASAGASVRIDGDRIADTIRGAVLDGLRRFMEGFEEGLREAESKAAEPSAPAAAR